MICTLVFFLKPLWGTPKYDAGITGAAAGKERVNTREAGAPDKESPLESLDAERRNTRRKRRRKIAALIAAWNLLEDD